MLRMVNKIRAEKNKDKLVMQPDLRLVARRHSADMAKKDYFSHKNKKGLKPKDRLQKARITDVASGENLAKIKGVPDPVIDAHEGLLKSPGHRKNILNKEFNVVGVGVVRSKDSAYYFTQMFAHRDLIFTKKIKKRARMNSGLWLKGKSMTSGAHLLCLVKHQDYKGVKNEDVFELEGVDFSFRLYAEMPGWHDVLVYFSPKGNGQFTLVNQFEVKFTYWF